MREQVVANRHFSTIGFLTDSPITI